MVLLRLTGKLYFSTMRAGDSKDKPLKVYKVGDIVFNIRDSQFGKVMWSKDGVPDAIHWFDYSKVETGWGLKDIRHATKPEIVLLRMTGKV